MMTLPANALSPRSDAPALPGTWKLAAGRAITLEPRHAGMLKVAHGQLWATYEGPHSGPLNDLGDHVIGVGDQLRLRAGDRVVVEAWNGGAPAYFSWDPLPVRKPVRALSFAGVMQPLADLRLALIFGAGAAGRLLAGVGGLAWQLVAGRETFEEQACRRHGALG
jgi:hypothetical protein